jgi:ribonuclease HI
MKKYLMKVKELSSRFAHFSVKKVPREENMEADRLARIGSRKKKSWEALKSRFGYCLHHPFLTAPKYA